MDLIPFSSDIDLIPQPSGVETPGVYHGVHITLDADMIEWFKEKLNAWFDSDERPEVVFVADGMSYKAGHGFIILEWNEYKIDPLFIAILRDEEIILDYELYSYGEGLEVAQ